MKTKTNIKIKKENFFELKFPNKELENRIKNLEKDKNLKTYSNSKELFEDLDI